MADQTDIRRIVHTLPHVRERDERFGFDIVIGAKKIGFIWLWLERVDPKRARVQNPDVLVLRILDLDTKEVMLISDPNAFFTEPHYDGYAAVLLRFKALSVAELRMVLSNAHAALVEKLTSRRQSAGAKNSRRVKKAVVRKRR